jgi:hypothetical protein
MTKEIKIRKHAPYRKSFLIPLWTFQLALFSTLFLLSGISLGFVLLSTAPTQTPLTTSSNEGGRVSWTALDAAQLILNLLLTASVIFVIVKFSNFTLTTKIFKIQSIIAVVLGSISTVVYFATLRSIMGIFPGAALLASIAICVRVCILRKRVKRGEIGEMRRPSKEVDVERDANVELEDGNKFLGVNGDFVGGSKAGASVVVTVGERLDAAKPRPSFNSVATGISGAPTKYVREFV